MTQSTIKYPISISGVGIHSGQKSSIRLLPLGADAGVVFRVKNQDIPAVVDQVSDTRFCTVLGHDEKVATIEHLMAAISAMGIDNLLVEVSGHEIPILDGSAYEFCFVLEAAGREILAEKANVFTLRSEVYVSNGDAYCRLLPSESMKFDFSFSSFPSLCLKQYPSASFDMQSGSFEHEIARARTFGMLSNYEDLKKASLALGANYDNTVALDDKTAVNPLGMRFVDEPVRHKVLDAVGDLRLLGSRLKAHFVGFGSGHAMNLALMLKAKELLCII